MNWYDFRFDVVFSGTGVFRRKYNMKLYFIDVHVVRLAEKQSASLIDTNLVRGGSRRTYLPVLPYGK